MIKTKIISSKRNIILIILLIFVLISICFSSYIENILYLKPKISNTKSTQIHFIDVGQGDAIAITFPNDKVMLVDSGVKEYKSKLTNYLNNVVLKGKKEIDYVLLTHPDIDHSGNMEYILQNYKVNTFIRPAVFELYENKTPYCENEVYRDLISLIYEKDIEVMITNEMSWNEGNAKVSILTAFDCISVDTLETNEFSPIVIVEENNSKILLSGDLTERMEKLMISKYQSILDVDILKLAHHGSKYSNCVELLNVTSPSYVVASCGENTYGHPANETIKRLLDYDKKNNTNVFKNFVTTLNDGNIIYSLDSDIKVDFIKNIDDYNFVGYYIYAIIIIVYLVYLILLPKIINYKKNRRFRLQNKQFTYSRSPKKIAKNN